MLLYNYYFQFLDSEDNIYKLRKEELTGVSVLYKGHNSVDSFTETFDYNINEENDTLWVRLPKSEADGQTDLVITLNTAPLRTITTGLFTVTLTPYTTGYTVSATPVPIYSKQGYSPRIIDGYWWQFDDTQQTFVNTGIEAKGTVITEGTVVNVAQQGNMNAITSNAVYEINNNITNNLTTLNQSVVDLGSKITNLEGKNYSVKVNGDVVEADQTGLIDLGDLTATPDENSFRMLDEEEEIDGVTYPKGTTILNGEKVIGTDASYYNTLFLVNEANKSDWQRLFYTNRSAKFDLYYTAYNTSKGGTCYYIKNGYSARVVTTSKEIADLFRFTTAYDGSITVYCKGAVPPAPTPKVRIVSPDWLSIYQKQENINFDPSVLNTFDTFLTTETKDWIEIEGSEYSTSVEELIKTNYLVKENLTYNFTDKLSVPISLTFKALNNSTITVTDGTFTTVSNEVKAGEIATLIYENDNNYNWNYVSADSEVVLAVTVNGETNYPVNGVVDLGTISGGDGKVKTVSINNGDKNEPDQDGNIDLTINTYTLELDGGSDGVKTVNHTEPDDDGNVELFWTDVSIQDYEPVVGTRERSMTAQEPYSDPYNVVKLKTKKSDNSVTELDIFGVKIPFGDGKVKTVNNVEPDDNGNITLPDVQYFDVIDYGKHHNALEVDNRSIIHLERNYPSEEITKLEVFDVPIDTYTLEVEGGVKSVDNQKPDSTGNVTLLPLYKNGREVRKVWPAYDKYDLDYDNDRRSYVDNNGSSSTITSMGYGNIILTGIFLEHRNEFTIPTTLSAYSTYGDYMKWTVYNATTTSEQIPINDTEVYMGDKIEVIFNKPDKKVFVFGSNGKLKLTIDLTE